jgi:hypothetical protein
MQIYHLFWKNNPVQGKQTNEAFHSFACELEWQVKLFNKLNKTKIRFWNGVGIFMVLNLIQMPMFAQTAAFWDSLRNDTVPNENEKVINFTPSADCVNKQLDHFLDSIADVKRKSPRIEGFRILLYSGNDREKASKAKEIAYRLIKKSDVYTSYQAPTFKVRLGDFYQKAEAFLALGKLKSGFPNAVIIPEIVNIKP